MDNERSLLIKQDFTDEEKNQLQILANSIRQGSKGKIQITQYYYILQGDGCCALGAIILDQGLHNSPYEITEYRQILENIFPVMNHIHDDIIWLNDEGGFSFEGIALELEKAIAR